MKTTTTATCTVWGCGFLVSAILGGWAWPYIINSILVWCHRPPQLEFWHGALLGFVPGFGQLSLPGAAIIWILHMFLG